MAWFSRWSKPAGRHEGRSITPQDVWGSDWTGIDDSMEVKTSEQALRLAPVYAAVSLISDQVAASPLQAYRESNGIKQRIPDPPLLSHPSGVVSKFEWVQQAMVSLLTHGNAYGVIVDVDRFGWPTQIEWLHPDMVGVAFHNGVATYWFGGQIIPTSTIVHIRAMLMPGQLVGISPIKAFKNSIEAGLYAEKTARDWFRNGAIPSVHLKNTATTLKQSDVDTARARYLAVVRGRAPLVTGNDWSLSTITVPADEQRFIEMMHMTATQIAAIYKVPPEKIGGEAGHKSLTYQTVEQAGIDFVRFTLQTWYARIEAALSDCLPRGQYVKFNADALVRGDLMSRMQAYEIAVRIGALTVDELRALEDRPPLTQEEKDALKSAAPAPVITSNDTGAPTTPPANAAPEQGAQQ